jgi:phosphoribosylglycinamide formyltransferase 1
MPTTIQHTAQQRPHLPQRNIVILISGSGSNMQAIVRAAIARHWAARFNARIAAVISNSAEASGLVFAQSMNIDTHVIDNKTYAVRSDFDLALQEAIDGYSPSLVVLAGFMRILGADFVTHYAGKMVNIHPSLLPAFTGLHTHQRAIDAGCHFAGATVHRVTPVLDDGEILAQAVVPVLTNDNAGSLAARVLTQEHLIYPAAIENLLIPLEFLCIPNNS